MHISNGLFWSISLVTDMDTLWSTSIDRTIQLVWWNVKSLKLLNDFNIITLQILLKCPNPHLVFVWVWCLSRKTQQPPPPHPHRFLNKKIRSITPNKWKLCCVIWCKKASYFFYQMLLPYRESDKNVCSNWQTSKEYQQISTHGYTQR